MLFDKRQQLLAQFTGNAALGNQISFSIPRTFFADSFLLRIPVTVSVSDGGITWTPLALLALVQNIQLQISDGGANRTQTNASGAALIRYGARVMDGLDIASLQCTAAYLNALEAASAGSSAGDYIVSIPLLFQHPQISDPVGSAFLLPLPRFNTSPTLQVTLNNLAAIGSGAGFNVTLGSGSTAPYVVLNFRDVVNIQFPTLDTEFIEMNFPQNQTGANQLIELQVPGSYTNLDYWLTNASGVPTDITGGPCLLQFLGQSLRQFNFQDLLLESQYAMSNDLAYGNALVPYFPNYYHQDFLHDGFGMEVGELGSVLDVNLLSGSGTRLQLLMNLASTGNVSIAWQRVFGALTALQFNLGTSQG